MRTEKLLKQIALFNACTSDEIHHISRSATIIQQNQGAVIIKEGSHADALYIILKGSVQVYTHEREGNLVVLARLDEDSYFGEHAYLNNMTRTVSVKALTDVELVEVNYDLLDPIFKKSLKMQSFLHQTSLARSLSNLQTQLLSIDSYVKKEIFTKSKHTHIKHFKKNEIIFSIGDDAGYVYFISSGSVSLSFGGRKTDNTPTILGKNHIFGEMAVLYGRRRSATAKAIGNTSLIAISGMDFLHAVKQSIGFRSLMIALGKVYAVPLNKQPIDQSLGNVGGEEAVFLTYKISDTKTAIYTKLVSRPYMSIQVSAIKPDTILKFQEGRTTQRSIMLLNRVIVGITAVGEWEEFNLLSEMLLDEVKVTHKISEKEFAQSGCLFEFSEFA